MNRFEAEERARMQYAFDSQTRAGLQAYELAQRRSAASGRHNQRLAELTVALRSLSADAWPGLDVARAAEAVLPVLTALLREE